ncbi:hypothetical protein CC1G_07466 [Coprinopsis cinerea okayama7|uniref:DUF6699 domain-containing protein n=1 Tax=Coprinopsis cinerea (strain Okayama-7 / 130 / ATCC MYA-4618 / FGSC 9003) TaxID=240176 RepID=A8NB96_COPC7|nr:hypothetical protein CC1G_07466 [Coprinopsis cinerea okayama7\|eukprot:XP_001832095.1 hypothetical protein CC1G_07466 [Coprinopsis cinerea okayama7\
MPGLWKKVRFSKTNTVVSPPTPALTAGSLSPASSAALITPPDYPVPLPSTASRPGPMPYYYQPFSSSTPSSSKKSSSTRPSRSHTISAPTVRAHRYLEASSRPAIHFDLQDHPSTASRHQHHLSPDALDEPATTPPLKSLTLKSEILPWHIRILPSHRRSYVTVGDVLDQLYSTLRSNLTQMDYDALHSSEKAAAIRAYEQRYRRFRSRSEYSREKAGGMKRVDLLMGHTRFMGLSRTKAYDVWILNTG